MTFLTRARTLALLATAAATATATAAACGGSYHPDTTAGADASADSATATDATLDSTPDVATCGADLATDAKNCGRCGHDCKEGACQAGMCSGVQLAATGGPLRRILLTDSSIFVSTVTLLANDVSGLFRVPKAGGTPERYAPYAHAEAMAALGDTLYFVVNETAPNPSGETGGLYSCPLVGPAPCVPTLIAAANLPTAITVDKGRVFYNERGSPSLMVYAPPGPPTTFRSGTTSAIGLASNLYVDGENAFASLTALAASPPQQARVFELPPDGGQLDTYVFTSDRAAAGRLVGTPDALFFTAYDYSGTTAGVMRRIPRGSSGPCDLGGSLNARPYGIFADATNVYWANQGTGAALPYANGSIVFCATTSCCIEPTVLWKGAPQPTDITSDADAIYFVTYGGSIWKVAKP